MAQVLHAREVTVPGMTARVTALGPGEILALAAGGGEALAYVIAGGGVARVPETRPLAPESVVWLAGDDTAELEAGARGLELLLAASRSA